MKSSVINSYAALERHFHEPHRLAIMSVLCGAVDGVSFTHLKNECDMTDGNLSRHLKKLEDAQAIIIDKSFVAGKPRTMIFASESGRETFIEYLAALETVLKKAAKSVQESDSELSVPLNGVLQS